MDNFHIKMLGQEDFDLGSLLVKGQFPLEYVISEMDWTDIWYAHMGSSICMLEQHNPRWHVGVWTGEECDLLCIAYAETNDLAEKYLSPGGVYLKDAVVKALKKAAEVHPEEKMREKASQLLLFLTNEKSTTPNTFDERIKRIGQVLTPEELKRFEDRYEQKFSVHLAQMVENTYINKLINFLRTPDSEY